MKLSKALSIALNPPKTFEGRKIGILITDGIDFSILEELKTQIKAEKAAAEVIAFTVGGIETKDGKKVAVDQKLQGAPSVLYDAIVILSSSEGTVLLSKHPFILFTKLAI